VTKGKQETNVKMSKQINRSITNKLQVK